MNLIIRSSTRILLLALGTLLLVSCASAPPATPEARGQLAPSGRIRAAINYGNPALAARNPATGELRGISVLLSQELGRRVGVPVELVGYDAAGKLVAALKAGEMDVGFLAVDPARAEDVAFTAPYMEVEVTYVVPERSDLQSVSQVDRPGIRVSVTSKNAADLFLTRELKHASLVRVANEAAAFAALQGGSAEAYATNHQALLSLSEKYPGYRAVSGRFTTIPHALGVPVARTAAAEYLRRFVEEAKASGLVGRVIDQSGVRGVVVAPPAK